MCKTYFTIISDFLANLLTITLLTNYKIFTNITGEEKIGIINNDREFDLILVILSLN
jgi:hypothetical protein